MTRSNLETRKKLLERLGFDTLASRASWSHDLGESIVFDAWEHQWERDSEQRLVRYPLRTNGPHYNLANSRQNPRHGHTRWQKHVDLVISGERQARAILPRAIDPSAKSNKGAKGWLPLVVEGHPEIDDSGQVWLRVDQVVSL